MTLENCAPTDWLAPGVPIPSPEQPAYLDDLAPCPACHNSGEPCGGCGGGGYGDGQAPHQPNQDEGGIPVWATGLTEGEHEAEPLPTAATLFATEASCPDCGWTGDTKPFIQADGSIECPACGNTGKAAG